MTKPGLPKWVSEFQDRHGKWRFRARRKGSRTHYFENPPHTEDFWAEYRDWREGRSPAKGDNKKTIPGTVSDVIARYYVSTPWRSLAKSTQAARRNILEKFREEHGDKAFAALECRHVQAMIDEKWKTPFAAQKFLKVLRALVKLAIRIGIRHDDPTTMVDARPPNSEGHHSWTEEEILAFENKHPFGTRARLALALLLYTGQRRGDVVQMGWQHVRDGRIHLKQQKTGKRLAVKMLPQLRTALDALPQANMTFLVTEYGKPFTPAGFGNWFKKQCRAAGLPNYCSAHGLRHAADRRLAEAGCTTNQISAITGHTSLRELQRYTSAADQQKMADEAISVVDRMEQERNLANPETRLAKAEAK